jgi:D-sedoheptulose 7-phosphate isomerase
MNSERAQSLIARAVAESIEVKRQTLDRHSSDILEVAACIASALRRGNKVILFGNGGSAADAQHVAGELVNRFLMDRPSLAALALTTDTSVLTAVANDSSFEEVFARQVEALARSGDVAIGISTSGESANVLRGIEAARAKDAVTVGLTGRDGGVLKDLVDICLCVPSDCTPRIQEAHITIMHIVCELVEQALFGDE